MIKISKKIHKINKVVHKKFFKIKLIKIFKGFNKLPLINDIILNIYTYNYII